MQTGDLDEAERKRLERNLKQQKRRAKMSDEQRQEINRRQREYRARKKAESSQISNNTKSVLHPKLTTSCLHLSNTKYYFCEDCDTQLSGPSSCLIGSTVVQTKSLQCKENLMTDDPMDRLHKKDNYMPARVSGHRTVATPHTQGNLIVV